MWVLCHHSFRFALDAAKTTVTIAAAMPRGVFSGLPSLAAGHANVTTGFDLSATSLGHNKIWWENRGFAASTITYDEGDESQLYIDAWGRAVFA